MKYIKRKWIIATATIIVLLIVGCSGTNLSQEMRIKKALKRAYNEDFVVHEIDNDGLDCQVTVSPKYNTDVVFTAKVLPDGTIENSEYFQEYVNYLLEEILESDIKRFFPDSYVIMRKTCLRWEGDSSLDFRTMNIEEIMDNSVAYEGGAFSGCYLDIYVNKDVGSTKNYEKEYEFFNEKIDSYIQQKRMLPVTITIYYVEPNVVERMEEYFKKDADRDQIFEKQVLGVDRVERGIVKTGESDLGNPPNITICLKKDKETYVRFDEYKRRREVLENGR